MQAKLLGYMLVDFINTKGEQIKGNNIFVAFKDNNVQGLRTEKFFLNSDTPLPEDIKVNDVLELSFNFKGKLQVVSKA